MGKMARERRRSEGQVQISISLPKDLLEEIDRRAALEQRSRSNWMVRTITRSLAETEVKPPAPERHSRGVEFSVNDQPDGGYSDSGRKASQEEHSADP